MGNTPSKSTSNAGGSQSLHKKIGRRTSIQALSGIKSAAVDPSPTKDNATGYSANPKYQIPLQQRLQSKAGPDPSKRGVDRRKLERQTSNKIPEGDECENSLNPARSKPQTSAESPRTDQTLDQESTDPNQYEHQGQQEQQEQSSSYSQPPHMYYPVPTSQLTRPPRLPLPIVDTMTAPGSPLTTSGSLGAAATFDRANMEGLTEKSDLEIMADEDDGGDDVFGSSSPGGYSKTVPTTIEWRGGGEKVYVTGTFVNWDRKFKLFKNDKQPRLFTVPLQLRPGTHHIKFIVDGIMTTSEDLPTAVDFTNHLVNYIEISADDVEEPQPETEKSPKVIVPPDIFPPQVLPEALPLDTSANSPDGSEKDESREEIPMSDFRQIIPRFLVDIDRDEDEAEYQQAATVIGDSAAPPMLPLFLARSILNSATPMKDDSSVLNYPNHTVLNHLATSSIKYGVLATSATTRYRRKYVTTILYKPTGQ
ncbi:hypothetical protein FQN57_006381 [Myotisia sp. PD_48]|nr:hypothetical protein FQN57_006381 [Myotisia sp. PD_48]